MLQVDECDGKIVNRLLSFLVCRSNAGEKEERAMGIKKTEAVGVEPVYNPGRDFRLACVFMRIEVKAMGPAGGNQGAGVSHIATSLNTSFPCPVTGTLGVIGLSGRAHQGGDVTSWQKELVPKSGRDFVLWRVTCVAT